MVIESCIILTSAVFDSYIHVVDRQRDGRTDGRAIAHSELCLGLCCRAKDRVANAMMARLLPWARGRHSCRLEVCGNGFEYSQIPIPPIPAWSFPFPFPKFKPSQFTAIPIPILLPQLIAMPFHS